MTLTLTNRDARRLWLSAQGLDGSPAGELIDTVKRIGFVQLDTIQICARAHHHILWSRDNRYREPMLDRLLSQDRLLFEHFTHDASLLPMDFYPYWRRQFDRMGSRVKKSNWGTVMPNSRERAKIRRRIEEEGALSSRDFKSEGGTSREGWSRPPHKFALDYLWYAGVLTTAYRKNFIKYYDLAERVIPERIRSEARDEPAQIDWLCGAALERLMFASAGELQRFWDATDLGEVKDWIAGQGASVTAIKVVAHDGGHFDAYARSDLTSQLSTTPRPTRRLRIINPFDPVVRDRSRLQRLFGFDYRIEIFTPAAKRKYGYYVYPILEGDRFVGRIEVRADRKAGVINVNNLWPEPATRPSAGRAAKLDAELKRLGRFTGAPAVNWHCDNVWAS